MQNVTEIDPISNYLVVLDFTKDKNINFDYYYKKDTIELENCNVYQFIYLREDKVSEFKFKIIRDWESENLEKINEGVTDVITKFKTFTNLVLNEVKHDNNETHVYFERLKSSDLEINLPMDLKWIK